MSVIKPERINELTQENRAYLSNMLKEMKTKPDFYSTDISENAEDLHNSTGSTHNNFITQDDFLQQFKLQNLNNDTNSQQNERLKSK